MAIIVRNCGFQKLETHGSKPEKVTLPVEGSVDCKKLELMVLNVVLFCLLSHPPLLKKAIEFVDLATQNGDCP